MGSAQYLSAKQVAAVIRSMQPAYQKVTPLILDARPNFDTVHVWFQHSIAKHTRRELLSRSGTKSYCTYDPLECDLRWRSCAVLQQPTDAAFEFLDDLNWPLLFTRVDAALDYFTGSREHADQLLQFFVMRQVKLHHGKQVLGRCGNTFYTWSPKGKSGSGADTRCSQIVLYSDKPSKEDGSPCLHMEWRAIGAEAVRQMGIETTADLCAFDHRAFWTRRLRLYEIDHGKLARLHQGLRRRSPKVRIGRKGQLVWCDRLVCRVIARNAEYAFCNQHGEQPRPGMSVQMLKDYMRGKMPLATFKRCLTAIPLDPFLP